MKTRKSREMMKNKFYSLYDGFRRCQTIKIILTKCTGLAFDEPEN
jgi:hypothetical protein